MKTTITTSVALNVLLLGAALLLWRHPWRTASLPPVAQAIAPRANAEAPAIQSETMPFHWNQLLCTNGYRAFVAHLRAAGCPEATVDDIVRGDTGRAFATMRARLGVSATDPGQWSEQSQMQMVAYFLGQNPTGGENSQFVAAPLSVAPDNADAGNVPAGDASLAAFLENADLTNPGMTTEQQQEIAGLRQGLLAQISGAGQVQNRQDNSSSQSASDTQSSQSDTQNTQTAPDSSQTTGTGQTDKRSPWHQPSPALLQAAEEESIVAGVFGSGAGMQFEQYQSG
ncbi:MAG TPA: hypothetical protein VGY98_03100, partial [Verrucomicrobiae bacterium]|nr:hypothetical protein [Verrucomicrobiae bacterium]